MAASKTLLKKVSRSAEMSFWILAVLMVFNGCSLNSASRHFSLGEKLWNERNYSAAVLEFDKASAKEPQSSLGLQAMFRSAFTQATFLTEYQEALNKFSKFVEIVPNSPLALDAQKQIAEILFSKLEFYDRAIAQYEKLLKAQPNGSNAPEYLFRIGKSNFYLQKFKEATKTYRQILKQFPRTKAAEMAAFEIGVTYFTKATSVHGSPDPARTAASIEKTSEGGFDTEQSLQTAEIAIDAFRKFIRSFPKSEKVAEAKFGIASCLEELDQLDAAYYAYKELEKTYPSPKVIQIKLARIVERLSQRSH